MRDIRLRVWDKTTEYMDYRVRVTWIDGDTKVEVLDGFTNWRELNKDDYILMQSTGYQDEDAEWIEVYEGDIVDFMDYGFEGESEYNCRGQVIFEDGAWHITNSISTSELFNYEVGAIKVIGNVFEDGDLLNDSE